MSPVVTSNQINLTHAFTVNIVRSIHIKSSGTKFGSVKSTEASLLKLRNIDLGQYHGYFRLLTYLLYLVDTWMHGQPETLSAANLRRLLY